MIKRFLHKVGIILISLSLNACMTLFTQTQNKQDICNGPHGTLSNVRNQNGEPLPTLHYGSFPNVYSGFIMDLQCFAHYACDSRDNCGIFYYTKPFDLELLCLIDTPLSFLLDTVFLPYTIYKQNKYGNICNKKILP
jgi:uncharacterized protein YceK